MIILGVDPGLLDAGLVVLKAEGDEPWPVLWHQHWQPVGKHPREKTPGEWHNYAWQLHDGMMQLIIRKSFWADGTDPVINFMALQSHEGVRGSEGKRSHPAIISVYGGYWTAVGVAQRWRIQVLDYHVMSDIRSGLGATGDGEVKQVLRVMGYPVRDWTTHEIDALATARHAGIMERLKAMVTEEDVRLGQQLAEEHPEWRRP